MKQHTLEAPSTVVYEWRESRDRRQYTLHAYLDGWEIATPYAIRYLDGAELEEHVSLDQLEPGTAPGWYVKDDCGDIFPEPLDPEEPRPLDAFLWREIADKLAALRTGEAASSTRVLHRIDRPWSPGVIEVYGEPDMGWYEWRIVQGGTVLHDSGRHGSYGMQYGAAGIALRDALIHDTED